MPLRKDADPAYRATFFARLAAVMAAIGLFYMAGTILLMWNLHQSDVETCDARQAARTSFREYLVYIDEQFTESDQIVLDQYFPPEVDC